MIHFMAQIKFDRSSLHVDIPFKILNDPIYIRLDATK
jgi:hypothetical protein